MTSRRNLVLAAVLVASIGASGCSTLDRFHLFGRNKDGPQEVAEGDRISIVPADQQLVPAETLKGVEFSLSPPAAVTDWPLPGGTPEQWVGNVDAAPNLSIAWRRDIGRGSKGGYQLITPPVAAGGKIFVMDAEAGVSARDARTGAEVWRTNVRPNDSKRDREGFGGGVAFADGKLYVTSGYREVVQLDAQNGAIGWRTRTEQPIHGAPTVSGGRLFVVSVDNTLQTFDTATGAPGWNYQALSESARILAAPSPAVSGDTVVAGFGSGELMALRAGNGNDLWSQALSRATRTSALSEIRDIPGRPVIYQGDVYAVSHSGVFLATDLRTGEPRWSLPVVGVTTPLPSGDVVYAVSRDGLVICAQRENGQIYWIRDLNTAYVGKKEGGFLGIGRHAAAKPVWSGPLLANDRLILVSSKGELAALNGHTGEIQKRMKLGGGSRLAPIAVGDTIYVVTDEAQLIAIR